MFSKDQPYTKNRAVIELLFAGFFWGYGFLATKWALIGFSVYDVLFYRYLIAFVVGEFFLWLVQRDLYNRTHGEIVLAIGPGLLMASFIIPQTIGLVTTTATKSGFITTLYVILVPIINQLIFRTKIDLRIYILGLMALGGTILLLDINSSIEGLNEGDIWTLVCAIMAAFQIIALGRVVSKSKSSFRFNSFQNLWTLICLVPFFIFQERTEISNHHPSWLPWFGIISMAIGSSIIAFTIQVRAQKVLSPETASQFFLLESPYAFAFGYLFLNETLNGWQLIGAVAILLSAFLSLRLEQISHSKQTTL